MGLQSVFHLNFLGFSMKRAFGACSIGHMILVILKSERFQHKHFAQSWPTGTYGDVFRATLWGVQNCSAWLPNFGYVILKNKNVENVEICEEIAKINFLSFLRRPLRALAGLLKVGFPTF